MRRKMTAICLISVMAFSVGASSGCSSGSGNNLSSSVSQAVGTVSSADSAMHKANAAALSNACKSYYAAVVAGSVSSENPGAVTFDKLPSMMEPASKKKNSALMLTVGGAMQYSGLTYLKDTLNSFVADNSTGTIYAIIDENKPSTATVPVTQETTLHQLGYR